MIDSTDGWDAFPDHRRIEILLDLGVTKMRIDRVSHGQMKERRQIHWPTTVQTDADTRDAALAESYYIMHLNGLSIQIYCLTIPDRLYTRNTIT